MASHHQYSDQAQPTKIAYINGDPKTVHIRRARLVVHPGTDQQRELFFDQNVIKIGALEDNDVVLSDDTVSRHHCRIIQEDDVYIVSDLNSTNGTHINGVRIREAYLSPNVILCVGNTNIRFSPIDEEVPIEPSKDERLGNIVGRSVKMREIFDILEKIAPTASAFRSPDEAHETKVFKAQYK